MNYKTNFYGAIGLTSTIGKHSFGAGQAVSSKGQWVFQKARENLIELKMDLAIVGEVKVFESLENASKRSEEKFKKYEIRCQEWETRAQEKYEKAKKEEERKEEWRQSTYNRWFFPQPSTYGKVCNFVQEKRQKYFPQTKLETAEKAIYRPNCLRFVGIYY